jgi:hypothetical protein
MTTKVAGLSEFQNETTKAFADYRSNLAKREKEVQSEVQQIISDTDEQLRVRYSAAETLLKDAQGLLDTMSEISPATSDGRLVVAKRLHSMTEMLARVATLPSTPQDLGTLFAFTVDPAVVKRSTVVKLTPSAALFSAAAKDSAGAAASPAAMVDDEDDDTLLGRFRSRLKVEDELDSTREDRDNSRFQSIRVMLSSGMDPAMQRETIGAIIFDRCEQVLGTGADVDVFAVSSTFLEKNTLDHIMENLSTPAAFNREIRAIHLLLQAKLKSTR